MANPVWPASLPAPAQPHLRETPGDNTVRSEMDVGPAKVRRRHTAAVDRLSLGYELTTAQIATLDTFFKTTTKHGSIKFDFTNPRTSVLSEYRFAAAPVYEYFYHDTYMARVELEKLP